MPMAQRRLILGFNGGDRSIDQANPVLARHDAAAVLLHNGHVVAAIEQERLDRLKHSNCFPEQAIRQCLAQAGVTLDDVDVLATNTARDTVRRWARDDAFTRGAAPLALSEEAFIGRPFARCFGVDVAHKIRFCPHHLAHAVSAFVPSGYERALIVSLDGDGDARSGNAMTGTRSGLHLVREFSLQQSLGHLYAQCIALLGYGIFDEYKVMGLAPYGDPTRYRHLFAQQYKLLPDGDFYLKPYPSWLQAFDEAGLLTHIRGRGEGFTQLHQDFAAALQATLERIVFHVLRALARVTGERNLCLAGGVAHNCTLTGKILQAGLFENVFVQPAAHDAGGSLGAAWQAHLEATAEFPLHRQQHVFWGKPLAADEDIAAQLEPWSACLTVERPASVEQTAASLLAGGAVLGWVQGRSEFGPRALGNRSILADPQPAENKRRINAMVKKREGYRPFAPSVQETRAGQWFELPAEASTLCFMNFIVTVKPEFRSMLGAITHVDGTARIQTVSQDANPRYWQLIEHFRKLTGIPILLNTSLNNHAEPVVDSVQDAITCLLTTGLEGMVIGPYLLRKRSGEQMAHALLNLSLQVSPGYLLLQKTDMALTEPADRTHYMLNSVKAERLRTVSIPLSEEVYRILVHADGTRTVTDLLAIAAVPAQQWPTLTNELVSLWEERAISLRPPQTVPLSPE